MKNKKEGLLFLALLYLRFGFSSVRSNESFFRKAELGQLLWLVLQTCCIYKLLTYAFRYKRVEINEYKTYISPRNWNLEGIIANNQVLTPRVPVTALKKYLFEHLG